MHHLILDFLTALALDLGTGVSTIVCLVDLVCIRQGVPALEDASVCMVNKN